MRNLERGGDMIESIYSKTEQDEFVTEGRKPPKNVRQIGYFTGNLRIYTEDYVHSFVRWVAEQNRTKRCAAVLVGEFAKSEHSNDVYVYGTIMFDGVQEMPTSGMTQDQWEKIYESMKLYFPGNAIVGWFYGGSDISEEERRGLTKIHLDNFAGNNRIVMVYDVAEREEDFYRFEGETLVRQSGYYIFYEKNEAMQNYMLEQKKGKVSGEQVEDRAVKQMRNKLSKSRNLQDDLPVDEVGMGKTVSSDETPPRKSNRMAHIAVAALLAFGVYAVFGKKGGIEQHFARLFDATEEVANETKDKLPRNGGKDSDNSSEVIDWTKNINEVKENSDEAGRQAGSVLESEQESGIGIQQEKTEKSEVDEFSDMEQQPTIETSGGEVETEKDEWNEAEETIAEQTIDTESKEESLDSNKEEQEVSVSDETNTEEEAAVQTVKETGIDYSKYSIYVVQPGDTLQKICKKRYGSLEALTEIKELNQIMDENLIYAYQELLVP